MAEHPPGVLEEEDLYESLPSHSLYVHLLAGAAAGMMEHCVMYPIDSVKTRMQSLYALPQDARRAYRTPFTALVHMMRTEGVLRPMRGVSSVAVGAIPAHALYFTVYEKAKLALTGGRASHSMTWAYGLAGAVATMAHDAVMNPAEVVKQRMQMCNSPFNGCVECATCVYKREGWCAFYRSYATQLLLNIPFQSVHFMVYEFGQQTLNPARKYDPKSHLISGGLAGGVAAAVTCPLDVVKTVLNTQQQPLLSITRTTAEGVAAGAATATATTAAPLTRHCPASYKGIGDAVRGILATKGARGLFAGFQARVLVTMPATALSWSVYELFKMILATTEGHSQ